MWVRRCLTVSGVLVEGARGGTIVVEVVEVVGARVVLGVAAWSVGVPPHAVRTRAKAEAAPISAQKGR